MFAISERNMKSQSWPSLAAAMRKLVSAVSWTDERMVLRSVKIASLATPEPRFLEDALLVLRQLVLRQRLDGAELVQLLGDDDLHPRQRDVEGAPELVGEIGVFRLEALAHHQAQRVDAAVGRDVLH